MVRFAILPAMKNTIRALALFLALQPALAAAQVPNTPQTLPANSVVGRLGIGAGPAQAIPLSVLSQNMFGTIPNNTLLGNVSGGPALTASLSATQATTLCNTFTSSLKGCAPASGGGTTNFLRADGAFAQPTFANIAGTIAPAQLPTTGQCLNILTYGGNGNGVADNLAAWNAAVAALPSLTGGCIYFPFGKYSFSTAISYSFASGPGTPGGSLAVRGDGSRQTILYWPNAGNGINVTANDYRQSVHFHGLSVTTGQVSAGIGINLINTLGAPLPTTPWSDFYDVSVAGVDIQGGGTVNYTKVWTTGVKIHYWSNFNFIGLNVWGTDGSAGTGVWVEGNGSSDYAVNFQFTQCLFNYLRVGLTYGSWVQGINIQQSGFGGRVGIAGIQVAGAAGSQPAGLAVFNSGFDVGGNPIDLTNATVNQIFIIGNTISMSTNGAIGVAQTNTFLANIVGNSFNSFGGTSQQCIGLGSPGTATVTGNTFSGCPTGVGMAIGSSNISMFGNAFHSSVTTKYVNNGTSPTPGTAPMP